MTNNFVPAANVIEIQLVFSAFGQTLENRLHFQYPGPVSAAAANILAEKLVTWWDTYLKPHTPPSVSLQRVVAKDASSQSGYMITYTTGLPLPGTGTDSALPLNVTAAVKLLTDSRGRAYRGRLFHVGLQRNAVGDNTLSPGIVLVLKAAYEALKVFDVANDNAVLAVVSKVAQGAIRNAALVTPVTSIDIDPTTDSQRRRLPGRGR